MKIFAQLGLPLFHHSGRAKREPESRLFKHLWIPIARSAAHMREGAGMTAP
jgi:hypothetical protein